MTHQGDDVLRRLANPLLEQLQPVSQVVTLLELCGGSNEPPN